MTMSILESHSTLSMPLALNKYYVILRLYNLNLTKLSYL